MFQRLLKDFVKHINEKEKKGEGDFPGQRSAHSMTRAVLLPDPAPVLFIPS